MTHSTELAALIENTPDVTWLGQAACRDLGVERLDLFFVDAGKSLSQEAAAVCRGCAVRIDCLTHAYVNEVSAGYFGGMSSAKRRALSLDEAVAQMTE